MIFALGGAPAAQSLRRVDVELVLAIDCSYSVDAHEFALQTLGLAEAFRHPAVLAAIAAGERKAIGVSVVQWSGAGIQTVAVPRTVVEGEASAADFAARVESTGRSAAEGGTSISSMIEFGIIYLATNALASARQVIDISGDGRNNTGYHIDAAKTLATIQGVTVNGLVILNEDTTLNYYFERKVIAGSGAFVILAEDYDSSGIAILRKLVREIGNPAVS